jgi:hypothetical protein
MLEYSDAVRWIDMNNQVDKSFGDGSRK